MKDKKKKIKKILQTKEKILQKGNKNKIN